MSPPGGTTGKGHGALRPFPPKDFYSPKACANCHSDSATPSGSTFGYPLQDVYNPDNLTFLPSPSDCPAEIFWPDDQKVYQEFVKKNPYVRGQNYLETLLRSRQGSFPLEVKDTSLGFYLGLKGPADFPKAKVGLPHDSSLCAGPGTGSGIGMDACAGLDIEIKDEDIGLSLEGLDLITAQDMDIEVLNALGVKIKQASVRNGRLMVTTQLNNPFLNSAFPLAFTSDALLSKLNPMVKKLLKSASPNPYDPDLYDLDVTDLLLEKMPVAYNVADAKGLTYAEYQAATDKSDLKTISYFFNIAREGKLPERLSFNKLYEAILETTRNIKSTGGTQDEAQKILLKKLLETISVRAQLHPSRLLLSKLFVEFEDVPGKNLFEAQVSVKNLSEGHLLLASPIQISRVFSPGLVDITELKGDLGVSLNTQGNSDLRIDNLQIALGRMEYTGTPEKGPPGFLGLFQKLQKHFKSETAKPTNFAILGGRITGIPDLFNNVLASVAPLRIQGNLTDGFQIETNLRLDAVQLRLPMIGEVTISGELTGKTKLIPKIEVVTQENGESKEVTRWVLEPGATHLTFKNLDFATEGGLHWQNASIEIFDGTLWANPLSPATLGAFSLRVQAPKIAGSAYNSLNVNGDLPIPKGSDGLYDLSALAEKFAGEIGMHALRTSGNPEDWSLNFSGTNLPDYTHFNLAVDSTETDPSGAVKRRPVEGLKLTLLKEVHGGTTSYGITALGKRINFPGVQISEPKFLFSAAQETTKNGGKLYTVPNLEFTANPWKSMPRDGLLRGPIWLKFANTKQKPFTFEIDGVAPTFEFKNLNLNFGLLGLTHDKLVTSTGGRITGIDIDGSLRGNWKMDYDLFKGKGQIVLAGDSGGEGDLHLRGADGLRLAKEDPRDPTRLVEIPIFSKTVWQLWNILGVDVSKERINGAFQLSTRVDPAFARVFNVIIDNGKVINWQMNHDHLPYSGKGYSAKTEEYIIVKAAEEKKAAEERKAAETKKTEEIKTP